MQNNRKRKHGFTGRTIHKWITKTENRPRGINKEQTSEAFSFSLPYTGSSGDSLSSGDNDDDQLSRSESVGSFESQNELGQRSGPFEFLRNFVSDTNERIPGNISNNYNICNMSTHGVGDRNSPQTMDGPEDTGSVGQNYDFDFSDDDNTIPTHEEEYEEGLNQLGRAMASKFVSGIHRYVSRVIVPSGIGGVQACLRELDNLIDRYPPPSHYYIISSHDDHVHVSHICGYSSNCCRCSFLVRGTFWSKDGRRGLRRVSRAVDLEPGDRRNILRYLSSGGRVLHRIGGFREDGRLLDRHQYLSAQRYLGQTERGLLAGCDGEVSWDVSCRPQSRDVHIESYSNVGGKNEQSKTYKKNQKDTGVRPENGPISITELLYQYPCCPPDAYKNIKEYYMNTNLNYLCAKDKYVDRDIELWLIKLMHWSLKDYDNYYKDEKVHPYFNAYNRSFDHVYYSINESVRIANELLLYQFDNDRDNVLYFLTDLLNILDKKIPKCNTLAILAPPNAGKNFFFDAVASFFINYGCLGTANKTNNFAFMEAAGKRLVLWNEPNYESHHVNELKALLGGDSCRVSVKYKGDQALQGPPIIILTNDNLSVFGMTAFQSRIKLYNWQSAPFLRNYDKKINPMFILRLFELYNLSIM